MSAKAGMLIMVDAGEIGLGIGAGPVLPVGNAPRPAPHRGQVLVTILDKDGSPPSTVSLERNDLL